MSLTRPRKIFIGVMAAVFLAVFGLNAMFTFMSPKIYASTARVEWPGLQDKSVGPQVDAAQSETVLTEVAASMNLNVIWGKKIRVDGELKAWESASLLKQNLEVSPVPDASAVDIRVYDDDSAEAARIANRIAEIFCALPTATVAGSHATIKTRAEPIAQPVRPNIPMRLAVGGLVSLVLAMAAGGMAGWLALLMPARTVGPT